LTFGILFVCHANLCRSPLAERLARRAFDDAFGPAGSAIATASAGIRGYDGAPMHRNSAQVLAECGVDAAGFVSRTVSPAILMQADLVLAAGGEQRTACLTMEPGAVRRAFTLRQFARFAAAVPPSDRMMPPGSAPPDRLRLLLDEVNLSRHQARAVPDSEDDLPDPVGQPIEAFRTCAEDVWRSLRTVVAAITVN
jgi:low molecular weight protein-tyrosine phosphatase